MSDKSFYWYTATITWQVLVGVARTSIDRNSIVSCFSSSCDCPEFRAVQMRCLSQARQVEIEQIQVVYQVKLSSDESKVCVSVIYSTQARPLKQIFNILVFPVY